MATLVDMPDVLLVSFFASFTTRIKVFRSGHASFGAIYSEPEPEPAASLSVVGHTQVEAMHASPLSKKEWRWNCMGGLRVPRTCTARESVQPVSLQPFCHATKPPKSDRQADPEPWRAMTERSAGESLTQRSFERA